MKPAQLDHAAPDRLVEWLAVDGFDVRLLIERAEEMTCDPGADVPDLDEAFSDREKKNIDGIVAAYGVAEPWAGRETEETPPTTARSGA